MQQSAITITKVNKQYRTGFWGKKFTALNNLNLEVKSGEILGYLGPNGSGKTTTFKVILGLIYPDSGSVSIFGKPNDPKARMRIGFLPENPYFYMYLSAIESLNFHGRLRGMSYQSRQQRIPELLRLVGLDHAAKKPLKKFSRGMLQRIGIAQALINDPDILILDEPMSGLDPTGRKQMRDIILGCRDRGKTVIFSSHILSDVEVMCDRAVMIQQGMLQNIVRIDEMLDSKTMHWEITCSKLPDHMERTKLITHQTSNQILLQVTTEVEAKRLINEIEESGGRVLSFGPQRTSLEDFFINTSQNN